MEAPADFTFWAGIVTLIAGTVAGVLGWLRRGHSPPPEQPGAVVHSAAIIDYALVRDLLAQVTEQVIISRRLADATEALLEVERARDKRKAAERHDALLVSKIEALQDEIADLKRGKR